MKITGYSLVVSMDTSTFVRECQKCIDAGWQPWGAPINVPFDRNTGLATITTNKVVQVFVKYEVRKPTPEPSVVHAALISIREKIAGTGCGHPIVDEIDKAVLELIFLIAP